MAGSKMHVGNDKNGDVLGDRLRWVVRSIHTRDTVACSKIFPGISHVLLLNAVDVGRMWICVGTCGANWGMNATLLGQHE